MLGKSIRLVLPIAAAAGTVYLMETTGTTDFLIDMEKMRYASVAGRFGREWVESHRTLGHIAYDFGAGAVGAYIGSLISGRLNIYKA